MERRGERYDSEKGGRGGVNLGRGRGTYQLDNIL